MEIEVICLETQAFHQLLDEVVNRMLAERKEKPKWLTTDEAMALLQISSKTTLQKLKNEGHIHYSQPMKKHVLYDRESILEYLDRHSREPFRK
ncbi:MAG: helix-turn-helix domain-containing protein [Bacteroidota bacterium]